MSTSLEKLQNNKPAVPVEVMETDKENLFLSRDAFEAKYRKKKEIAAKLAAEKARLEQEADEEMKALENVGKEEQASTGKEVAKEEE